MHTHTHEHPPTHTHTHTHARIHTHTHTLSGAHMSKTLTNMDLYLPSSTRNPLSSLTYCKTSMASVLQDSYIQERADTMQSIETTIVELGSIFQQLAHMVKEQEEMVQRSVFILCFCNEEESRIQPLKALGHKDLPFPRHSGSL